MRHNAKTTSMSELLEPPVEEEVKAAALVSMGSEISQDDLENIQSLCRETIEIIHYQEQLEAYLRQRMAAIAPNLSTLLGETVGARLISHTGSLINLAKAPGSTIQILGAEKALFRAIKTRSHTPKYGVIYHSPFISKAEGKDKGRISRYLANKTSFAARIDCFRDDTTARFGEAMREQVEERLTFLKTGKVPQTNTDVMRQVLEELGETKPHADAMAEETAAKQATSSEASSASNSSSESDDSSE